MVIRNYLISVLLLISIYSESQTRRFKHLTSADGISQSEVYSFLEDSRGFMWFGTVDGLNRYDGYHIEIFNTKIDDQYSLSNNTVRSLAEDKFGRIWIGTDHGLNLYDPETELIHQISIGSLEKKISIWSLYVQDKHLLMGSSSGLWRTEIKSNIEKIQSGFHKVSHFRRIPNQDNFIRALLQSKAGGIWIATSNGVSRVIFQDGSKEPVVIEDIVFDNFSRIGAAIEDSTGNLWVASTIDGLVRYNPSTKIADYFRAEGTDSQLASNKCSSLALDKDGNLWVGTLDRGLNFLKSNELNDPIIQIEEIKNQPDREDCLNSNLIYSLYVSNDNLLWAGTIGAGVNIYNPEQKKFIHYKFRNLNNEDLSNSNFVRSVYADNKGKIWTGTHGNGLFLLKRNEHEFQKLGFETMSVFHIYPLEETKKFICSSSGLYLVDIDQQGFRILSSDNSENAVFYIVKGEDNVFWLATLGGLRRIEIENDEIIRDDRYFDKSKPSISHNNCRVLFYDGANNRLFVGTEGGGLNVVTLDNNQFPKEISIYQKNNEASSLSNNYVRSVIKDSYNNIWVGTYEGLNKMITDSISGHFVFKRYTKNDGLPNNMIQLIVEDDNHNLWVGTNGGLTQFIPEEERFINFTV
ncbi:MAG TPA: two-component regulator propeller domain-containing protein, partial [Prolixibacteraceae bacterium]|nr:two-component regulator propeller domain-containing protein [Prolixibacteraceae bacterium]